MGNSGEPRISIFSIYRIKSIDGILFKESIGERRKRENEKEQERKRIEAEWQRQRQIDYENSPAFRREDQKAKRSCIIPILAGIVMAIILGIATNGRVLLPGFLFGSFAIFMIIAYTDK